MEQDGTATLTCTADGQPLPKLTWWSDGKEINAAKPRFSIATSDTASGVQSILTIQGLRMSDSAIYACKAENKAGVAITTSNVAVSGMYSTVTAKSHQLVSQRSEVSFGEKLRLQNTYQNNHVMIFCPIETAVPSSIFTAFPFFGQTMRRRRTPASYSNRLVKLLLHHIFRAIFIGSEAQHLNSLSFK